MDPQLESGTQNETHNPGYMAGNSLPLGGDVLFGRYSVVREIGRGGMGVVMLAHDAELGIDIALKLIPDLLIHDDEALDDLKQEVLKGMTLTHPGIVRTHGLVRDENMAAIVMEYVDGGNFNDLKRLHAGGCLEVNKLLPWVEQLCPALDYAHFEIQIAHRDLKPRNLMFTRSGRIKVADFGISSSLGDSMTRATMKGPSSGTPAYMSPQQIMGSRPSHLDDIYGLGATLYELLTGKPPFYKGEIVYQVLECVPAPLNERREALGVVGKEPIPEAWQRTIEACLSKNPASRPQSAGEVLRWLTQQETIPPRLPAQPERSAEPASGADLPEARRRGATRRRVMWAGSGVMAAGGLAMLPVRSMLFGSRMPPPAPLVVTAAEVLPSGMTGSVYQHVLGVSGGTPPFAWSIGSGDLPDGLAMDAAGRIHGIPQTVARFYFEVSVIDKSRAVAHRRLSLSITAPAPPDTEKTITPAVPEIPPPRIHSPSRLPDGVAGTAYRFSMSAEGGVPPFSWSLSSGGLPPGLELGIDGSIAGIPQNAGDSGFSVKAVDQAGMAAIANASLTVLPAPEEAKPPIPQLSVPHVNSLGMRFVASGTDNVYFSVWLTRVRDFRAFVEATNYNATERVRWVKMGDKSEVGFQKTGGFYWERPGFNQTDNHPVCGVSWDDAKKFCAWLTEKEHKDGSLPTAFSYRLPYDGEWRRALCLDEKDGVKPRFPWGIDDQPEDRKCNFAGEEIRNGEIPKGWGIFPGVKTSIYYDGAPFPSPVDHFPANPLGIHDMYGNLWQFCEDITGENSDRRRMRGGSWLTSNSSDLHFSTVYDRTPSARGVDAGFRCVIAITNSSL